MERSANLQDTFLIREHGLVSKCLACAKIAGISGILLYIWEGNGELKPVEKELERRNKAVDISLIKELLGCGYNLYVDYLYTN